MFNLINQSSTEPSLCPYCSVKLQKIPSRKTKCLKCGNFIYVRTRPNDRQQTLVTEAEARKIDDQWKVEPSHSYWIRVAESYGATKEDFLNTQISLRKQFGFEPPFRDVIWSLFNQSIKRGQTPYYSMALFLDDEGRDPTKMLQINNEIRLKQYKDMKVVRSVKIITAGDQSCESCKKLEGITYNIDEALKTSVLPCKNCSFHASEHSKYGFCRCLYGPEATFT